MKKRLFLVLVAILVGFTSVCNAQQDEISTIVYNMNTINSGTVKIAAECSSISITWGDGSKQETFVPDGKIAIEHNFTLSYKPHRITITASNLTKFHLYGSQGVMSIINSDSRIPEWRHSSDKELIQNSIEKYYGTESILFKNCNKLQEFEIANFPMLKTLNLSNLPALKYLGARHLDLLTNINVSNNLDLIYVNLSDDVVPPSGIDLSNNPQLQYLVTEDWICPVLDISKNTKLSLLYIEGTNILKQLILASNYPFLKKIVFEQSDFTPAQLNTLFNSLPARKESDFAQISLKEVSGFEKCSHSIATNKGWKFGKITEFAVPTFFNDKYPCVNCPEEVEEEVIVEEVVVEEVVEVVEVDEIEYEK